MEVVIATFYLLIAAIAVLGFYYFLTGAIYVPTADSRIRTMIALAKPQRGDVAIDLGSGDGRIVAALGESGATAVGIERNPFLVQRSRKNLRNQGLEADIIWKSFWNVDLSKATIVTVYGIPHIMRRLEHKLLRELPNGARVVSNSFPFPHLVPDTEEGGVYLYIIKR